LGTSEDLRKLLYSVLTIFVVAVTLGVVTNWRQYVQQERTEQVVCGLLADDITTERAKLTAYEQDPPQTDAGRAQREATQVSLQRYLVRQQKLGCN